jgi:small subunit ribosomal protein S2
MGGIKDMDELPGAIFVTGVKEDELAIKEARQLNIPIVGIVDTNANPQGIHYAIAGNDDALSSLRFILGAAIWALEQPDAVLKEVSK